MGGPEVVLARPGLLLALAIVGMLGPGLAGVVIALVFVWWASYARLVRGLVLAGVEVAELMLAVAALSFLGLGVQPPTPEWGAMLSDGRPFLLTAPHLMLLPELAISASAIGLNLLGEGLRDLLDPHLAPLR